MNYDVGSGDSGVFSGIRGRSVIILEGGGGLERIFGIPTIFRSPPKIQKKFIAPLEIANCYIAPKKNQKKFEVPKVLIGKM